MIERLPASAIAGVLAVLLVFALFVSSAIGRRRATAERPAQLGPLETMASGRTEGLAKLSSFLAEGERIQDELWATAARAARSNPDPPHALLMSALNGLIDLASDRRASIRMLVPQAVTVSIILACLAWAVILGYSAVARNAGSWAAWIVVSLLISIVFGVALDLDRPRSGFVTTKAAERSMQNVLRTTAKAPVD